MVTLGAAVPFPYGQGPPPQLASWSLQLPAAPLCPRDNLLHRTALLLAFLQQRGAQICGASPCGALLEARLSPGVSQPRGKRSPSWRVPSLLLPCVPSRGGTRRQQEPHKFPVTKPTALSRFHSHGAYSRAKPCQVWPLPLFSTSYWRRQSNLSLGNSSHFELLPVRGKLIVVLDGEERKQSTKLPEKHLLFPLPKPSFRQRPFLPT